MIATVRDLAGWIGRPLYDPYDAWVGTISGLREDPERHVPQWLEVTLADGGETRAVPAVDAVPSGGAIRTPHPLEEILAGRATPPEPAARRRAVQSPVPPAAGSRDAMVAALRDVHAQLRATLERLAALRWRVEDEELVHDLTFHHTDVEGHAGDVRRRLAELDDVREPLARRRGQARRVAARQAPLGHRPRGDRRRPGSRRPRPRRAAHVVGPGRARPPPP